MQSSIALSFAIAVLATPAEEFAALEQQMEAAHEEFLRSSDSGGRAAVPHSGDPRLEIMARMDALADAQAATPEGGAIALRVFRWSEQLRLDEPKLLKRFDLAVRTGASHEELPELLGALPDAFSRSASAADWIRSLDQLVGRTDREETKAAARLASGLIWMRAKDLDKARSAFRSVLQSHAESEEARLARGAMFEIEHLQIGMAAPDFTTRTIAGESVHLRSLRGKVVLLDFWATWCSPCLAETPHLKAAAKRFEGKPFTIVGVSLDDFKEMLTATIEQREMPGIQTWDEKGRENPIAELYNVQNLPQWFLLDELGIIRARNCFGEALNAAVEKLLPSKQ